MTTIVRGPAHGTFYTDRWRIELADSGTDSHIFYDNKEIEGVTEVIIHAMAEHITHITIKMYATEVKDLDLSTLGRNSNVYTNGQSGTKEDM